MHVSSVFLLCLCSTSVFSAATSRHKRQPLAVPLYAACSEYAVCSPPSVCYSGTCQCVQPYAAVGTQCVGSAEYPQQYQAPPRPAAPAIDPRMYQMYGYQAPAQAPAPAYAPVPATRPLYTDAALVSPQRIMPVKPVVYFPQAPPQRIQIHDTTYVREQYPIAAVPAIPAPAPRCLMCAPPVLVPPPPPTVLPTPPPPPPTTDVPVPTTTEFRLFDTTNIAYPGDFCQLPNTVCVGGSLCVNNICICRRGEEIVDRQCVRVEVTELPTSTTTTEIPTTETTTTTPVPTTTTSTTTTTTEPETTTSTSTTTTTTTAEPTTTTSTTTTITTITTPEPTTTTTTPVPTTTTPVFTSTAVLARAEETTPGCQTCCPQGSIWTTQGCLPAQIYRINVVLPPGQKCMNSAQCARGAYCGQGTCQCARRFVREGATCIMRK